MRGKSCNFGGLWYDRPVGRNLGCSECVIVRGGVLPRGLPVVTRGIFVVHPRAEDAAVPGWMIIAPVRHVEQWDDLSPREQKELGELIGIVSGALRAATDAEKIYVNVFAEVVAHLHVHVIARTRDVPAEMRGPRIFQTAGADPEAADTIARAVLARLKPRSPR